MLFKTKGEMTCYLCTVEADSLDFFRELMIQDGGPWYHEFRPHSWIKEPWNSISSLFFFAPVVFWIWKLKGQYREHKIILALLPLLFLNGLGSTLYHAFRDERLFLVLDFLPASLMSITLSVYLWTQIVKRWYYGLLIVIGFYLLGYSTIRLFLQFEKIDHLAPNFGYFFIGLAFLTPLLIIMKRTRFHKSQFAFGTMLFLALALLARSSDYPNPNPFPDVLPMGTHFLWHLLTVCAAFSMGFYLYHLKDVRHKIHSKN